METYPYTVQGLTEALSALGGSPGEVADTLLAAGHRGQLGRCSGCPVAVYLAAAFPDATKTFVAAAFPDATKTFVTGPEDGAAVARLYLDGTLGDYATSAPVGFLMAQAHSGHETEIARLAGARMVLCSEVNEDDRFDEAKVKQLTGGDTITARFMRQDHFTFTPTHQLWLMGNHKPAVFPAAIDVTVNADDHGTLARLHLDGDVVDTVLPPPVAEFVAAFDRARRAPARAIGRAPAPTAAIPDAVPAGPMEALAAQLAAEFGMAALPSPLEPPHIFAQLADETGLQLAGPR